MATARKQLSELCQDVILLPARYNQNLIQKGYHRLAGAYYSLQSGLKFSNYLVSQVELTPARVDAALGARRLDCCIFEYWHAVRVVEILHRRNIPCVLDTHDILWQSYARQMNARKNLPGWWKQRAIEKYRQNEENAWRQFDGLIAINAGERDYMRSKVSDDMRLFYAPMGTDLSQWPYRWQPVQPPRLAYYGGLGSPHNQQDALSCYQNIMPWIWKENPEAELWLVGSNPPDFLQVLPSQDRRVVVTGYVENVQDVLSTMSIVLCPWSGTYGFRSRIIEVMALGIPVVASPDAVWGMQIEAEQGIFLKKEPMGMVQACLRLLRDESFSKQQSHMARTQVENKFSYEATYGNLAQELSEFITHPKKPS